MTRICQHLILDFPHFGEFINGSPMQYFLCRLSYEIIYYALTDTLHRTHIGYTALYVLTVYLHIHLHILFIGLYSLHFNEDSFFKYRLERGLKFCWASYSRSSWE